MKEELKTCPFCGSEAKFVDSLEPYVVCKTEYCYAGYLDRRMGGGDFMRDKAIKAWNTRAGELQPLTVEEISKIIDAYFFKEDEFLGGDLINELSEIIYQAQKNKRSSG